MTNIDKKTRWLTLSLAVTAGLALASFSTPAEAKKLKNLKVLDAKIGKAVGKGMKQLTKGLGVKCVACHVKGKLDLDDVPAKEASRKFIKIALAAEKPGETEKAALAALLKEMKLEKAKDEKKIWKGVEIWREASKK